MANINSFAAPSENIYDWTQIRLRAKKQGVQAFEKIIDSGITSEDQLKRDKKEYEAREKQMCSLARRHRQNPEDMFCSCIRNWSRGIAIDLLLLQASGTPIRTDYVEHFEQTITDEIKTRISEIELGWKEEDKQRHRAQTVKDEQESAAKREKAERAYGDAFPVIDGLNGIVLQQAVQLQNAWQAKQDDDHKWAEKLVKSVEAREKAVEEDEKRIEKQKEEDRNYQLALRSHDRWGNISSLANNAVMTGKNTLGCLAFWLITIIVVLGALSLAIHHP